MTFSDDLIRRDRAHLWHPYTQEQTAPDPVPVVSAHGAELHGADGRTYLDLIASWWVVTHGHAHPTIAEAIATQAARLEQVIFAGFTHPPAVDLAERLAALLPGGLERVFYSDNGSTAVEVALKLAFQYWRNRGEPRTRFLAAVAERVRAAGALVVLDEVMTGFGRTGAMFAMEHAGVEPDLVCLSKALTAGFLPMAATVCRGAIFDAFLGETFDAAFAHGHSFTANPLGCAAALASLEVFEAEGTLERIAAIERLHRERLEPLAKRGGVEHPRALGVIGAIDLVTGEEGYTASIAPRLKAFFLERGLLIRPLGNVVYLLPPYCVTDAELHRAWDAIEEAVRTLVSPA